MHRKTSFIKIIAILAALSLWLSACNFPNILRAPSSSAPKATSTLGSSSLVNPGTPAASEAPAETAAPATTEAPATIEAPAATEAPAVTEAPANGALPTEMAITVAPPTQAAPGGQPPKATQAVVYPTYTTSEQPPQKPQPTAAGPQQVNFFLIGMNDNGKSGRKVGCGDSAIAVAAQVAPGKGVLKAALEQLLSIHDQYYGQSGLYNALYQSNLHLDKVEVVQGHAYIWLSGSLKSGGTCDDPRIKAQIAETALQFPNVHVVSIIVNGRDLQSLLSGRG
jgi:hypothetical protein